MWRSCMTRRVMLHTLPQDLHQHTVLPTSPHLYIVSMHHVTFLTASVTSDKTKEEDVVISA
jgi:hypothetical protein